MVSSDPSRLALAAARRELPALALLALIGAAVWCFIEIADTFVGGEPRRFDRALLVALRNPLDPADPIGPRWLEEMGRDFSALGGTGVLTLLTLAAIGYLILVRKRHAAIAIAAAVGIGIVLSTLLKLGFDRPRPDLVPHATAVSTSSFPSGHAMMSAVVYLTLGALLARVQAGVAAKLYLIGLSILLALLVGVTRVYLGVHWPSDVLAGWTAGAAWALTCWFAVVWLQRRGEVEPDRPEAEDT